MDEADLPKSPRAGDNDIDGGELGHEIAPLRLAPLLASVVGIALGAVACAALLAAVFATFYVVRFGPEAAADFREQIRFDLPLLVRVNAAVVSLTYVGVGIATMLAAALVGRARWRGLVAWRTPRRSRRRVAVVAGCALTYGAATSYALNRLHDHQFLISGSTDYLLVGNIVLNLALLAPLSEELFFRGWLYTALRARLGVRPAFLMTAVLFAAIHWDPGHRRMLLVLPLAVALGLLRELSGSIKPSIMLHAGYNAIIVALTLVET